MTRRTLLTILTVLALMGPAVGGLPHSGFAAFAKDGDKGDSDRGDNSGSDKDDSDKDDSDNSGHGGGSDDDDESDDGGNSGSGNDDDDDKDDDDNSGSGSSGSGGGSGGSSGSGSSGSGSSGGSGKGSSGGKETRSVSGQQGQGGAAAGMKVLFSDGSRETLHGRVFERIDSQGHVRERRAATGADRKRLRDIGRVIGTPQARDLPVSTVVTAGPDGSVTLTDSVGWSEKLDGGRYSLTDPNGNVVTRRRATQGDVRRMQGYLGM